MEKSLDIPYIRPVHDENYDLHWKNINFKDKLVLDLGSDSGSTASFFLKKGAKKIICVDLDEEFLLMAEKYFEKCPELIETVLLRIKSAKEIEDLIIKYKPDIVKVDIEGDELFFLGMKEDIIKISSFYALETHPESHSHIYKIEKFFEKCGFYRKEKFNLAWAPKVYYIIYFERKNE